MIMAIDDFCWLNQHLKHLHLIFHPTWCHPQYFTVVRRCSTGTAPGIPLHLWSISMPMRPTRWSCWGSGWCFGAPTKTLGLWIRSWGWVEMNDLGNPNILSLGLILTIQFFGVLNFDLYPAMTLFFAWLIGKVVKAGSYTGLLRVVSHMKGTPINQLVWDVWSLIMFNWPWVKWSKQPRGRYQWLDQIGGVLEIYK